MQSEEAGAEELEDYRITRMSSEDLDQVVAIERASFTDPWPQFIFKSDVASASSSSYAIVAKKGGSVMGYLVGYAQTEYFQIANIAVAQVFRRRGIGKELLLSALAVASDMGCAYALLEVRPSNVDAIRLYEESGFQTISRRAGYYRSPPEDALVMRRLL
jgi:[ribosomal protein S18]-alanine N-acetyltransferase